MPIIGVSASPIVNGNTDRMIRYVLNKSRKEHLFVNLTTLRFDPCRACAHLCARTNMCPLDDDLKPYLEAIMDAEALVLGTPVNAGNVNAWMFSFISRLWCFHHIKNLLADRPMVLVLTSLFQAKGELALNRFRQLLIDWNLRVNLIGHICYVSAIPPCFKCGVGRKCRIGELWKYVEGDEEKLKCFTVKKDMFHRWEDDTLTISRLDECSIALSRL